MSEDFDNMFPSQESIEEVTKKNFSMWNEALLTRDPKKVADLYLDDATFLPTVSGDFKHGPAGAEEYFEHFLKKLPAGEVVEGKVQILSPQCYLHSGMYNFEIGPDNNRSTVEARFSFVWIEDAQGGWKIAHHHSSLKPKEQ